MRPNSLFQLVFDNVSQGSSPMFWAFKTYTYRFEQCIGHLICTTFKQRQINEGLTHVPFHPLKPLLNTRVIPAMTMRILVQPYPFPVIIFLLLLVRRFALRLIKLHLTAFLK